MKYLKRFKRSLTASRKFQEALNESSNPEQIQKYLKETFPSSYFNSELEDRASEFVIRDDEELDDDEIGDYSEMYKDNSTGDIELDLVNEMTDDLVDKFNISYDEAYQEAKTYFEGNCDWYDPFNITL